MSKVVEATMISGRMGSSRDFGIPNSRKILALRYWHQALRIALKSSAYAAAQVAAEAVQSWQGCRRTRKCR